MTSICCVGDSDIAHTEPTVRAQGSSNVFVNGKPISCLGHLNTLHHVNNDTSAVHAQPISGASSKVFVNGIPVGRTGDPVLACTVVGQGSGNVFCG